ncbi:MAG: ABC-2 family transporter protein [Lachnospiraceae bacterium]|nr:ABC-2 family transporter protein [Lachnospiraceae bacterium]
MKKFCKIYLPFASNELKRQMSYKGAFYLFILVSLFGSFINYYLWMAIYGSSGKATIGNLTKNEMVIYVFMVYVTSSIVTITLADWVSEDVVKGSVAMNLIKPIDYRLSLMWRASGQMVYRFFVPGIFVWIGMEIYKVKALGMEVVSPVTALLYVVSSFLSFLLYLLFDFCFGMVAFFTTYIFGMLMAKEAMLSFLMGQLIPLSMFPSVAQKVFDFLPFSSMVYTPVMIYLGKYSGSELAFVMGRQVAWVIFLYLLGSLIWKKVTKRLVVLGG